MPGSVDVFVEDLEGWQRLAYPRLLSDIRSAAPFVEHIKWGNPYFEIDGSAVLKTFSAKEWINIYFFRGCELTDRAGLFEPTTNARMRTIRITPLTTLGHTAFRDLVERAALLAHRK
ncbi:DUF1801 domain-containing protein [Paenarthrobacter sp. PH39-S1]|uniref:DUF1801 domain-containing protein n=1 Tax=Paenarthrobacter sp. PH39-S1 TaxID=3046204 RepID=UPI0024BB99B6|nr:DUF1801 domain-containing protein [Paenarthrobacter sp. PH39-S1]MDJ0356664.1 DUF1801 domain-containing protein [Paenarthrobacter sp. PH39-S1]